MCLVCAKLCVGACVEMKLFLVLCLCLSGFGLGIQIKTTPPVKYIAKANNDITIKIMVHIDRVLTRKLVKEYKVNTRKKLKAITNKILEDAKKLFKNASLNQTVNFKLIDTRFLRNSKLIKMDENAQKYLKNYCEWQSIKKIKERHLYYSILLTGLDLFHMNNGKQVKSNTGRGYTRGMCHVKKSCTLIEWDPKIIGFLLAHEIGHSLGMRHDGAPYNHCHDQKHVMALRYDKSHQPTTWSPCSWHSLRLFMKSNRSWCVKNGSDRRIELMT